MRLGTSSDLVRALAQFRFPKLGATIAPLARILARARLKRQLRDVDSVAALQEQIADYFSHIVDTTTDGFHCQGIESLDMHTPTIFISNHRDISLDSAFLNYGLYLQGCPTLRVAIGDNLFSNESASDFMRVNKGFVVKRNVSGRKAMYEALMTTSQFIRESVLSGEQVWIAQRSGRAKDGLDRTDPALLKMLALAWREEGFAGFLEAVRILPVSISYELDPCDLAKAHELHQVDTTGEPYVKSPDEDLMSMIRGVTGQKGRVRLVVGTPVGADLDPDEHTPEATGLALDRQIVANLAVFPTHEWAWQQLEFRHGDMLHELAANSTDHVRVADLKQRCRNAPASRVPFVLLQYANLIRNKRELRASPREA